MFFAAGEKRAKGTAGLVKFCRPKVITRLLNHDIISIKGRISLCSPNKKEKQEDVYQKIMKKDSKTEAEEISQRSSFTIHYFYLKSVYDYCQPPSLMWRCLLGSMGVGCS